MEIVRTKAFARSAKILGASEADLNALDDAVAAHPEAGDVIKGLKGVRTLRFAMGGRGKRGGGRAIYLVLRVRDAAYLLLAYAKNDQADLSAAQRKAILAFLETLE
jgi:hypothetical protein